MSKPIYLFIDLNSYFATVEQQANPELRGKPIGVCEHSGGIILAPSKEAKLLGIKTGTATWEAKKICPQIKFVKVNPAKIRAMTSRFYRIMEDYSDKVEHVSVDEVSINLTGVCFSYSQAIEVALEIKKRMKKEMGEVMTASAGIAKNRLLAKIGTDLQKPDGLVLIVDPESNPGLQGLDPGKIVLENELYDLLELDDIPGIGKQLRRSLETHGINSLKGLSLVSISKLHAWYGITGAWLHDLANFRDAWKEVNLDERKLSSISHQFSLQKRKALYSKKEVNGLLWKLAEKVAVRMRQQQVIATRVSTSIHYIDGRSVKGSKKISNGFNDASSIMSLVDLILGDFDYWHGVNYFKVSVSGFNNSPNQQSLFIDKAEKYKTIAGSMDKINNRWGEFTVNFAPTSQVKDLASDTVGFGRTRERKNWQEE